jgi:pSer/pThr/pTyr-binding forkhead associated (FHA) protein
MPQRAPAAPWFEFASPDGGEPERTSIDKVPFVIGRGETADWQIDSFRVSREHATIECQEGEYSIRDLNSTNGTFVNGTRVQHAALHDGDVLLLANIEVVFFCLPADRLRDNATQVMTGGAPAVNAPQAASLVAQLRRTREALLLGCVGTRLQAIVELRDTAVFGHEMLSEDGSLAGGGLVGASDGRLACRWLEVQRLQAVDATARLESGNHLFLRIADAEWGADRLTAALERLGDLVAEGWQLVAQLPYEAICGTHPAEWIGRLRQRRIAIAYEGFTGGQQPWFAPGQQPDFLKLSTTLVRRLPQSRDHQRLTRATLGAADSEGCPVIAVGVRNREEAEICRELGCRLGQGPWLGNPQPIEGLR